MSSSSMWQNTQDIRSCYLRVGVAKGVEGANDARDIAIDFARVEVCGVRLLL